MLHLHLFHTDANTIICKEPRYLFFDKILPTGQNMHLMLSLLIKHIEHKTMVKQQEMQLSIVEVAATLVEQSIAQASAATIGAISDLVRHLKRTFHITLGSKDSELVKWNEKFRKAIDDCLGQLAKKVCSFSLPLRTSMFSYTCYITIILFI